MTGVIPKITREAPEFRYNRLVTNPHIKKLVLSFVLLGLLLIGPAAVFLKFYSQDAPIWSTVSGAVKLNDPKVPFVEIEPGMYMFREKDMTWGKDYPYHAHLAKFGWKFEEQMGARCCSLHYHWIIIWGGIVGRWWEAPDWGITGP